MNNKVIEKIRNTLGGTNEASSPREHRGLPDNTNEILAELKGFPQQTIVSPGPTNDPYEVSAVVLDLKYPEQRRILCEVVFEFDSAPTPQDVRERLDLLRTVINPKTKGIVQHAD